MALAKWGVSPKTGKWEIVLSGPMQASGEGSHDDKTEARTSTPGMQSAEAYPVLRAEAGFVLVTTGAG